MHSPTPAHNDPAVNPRLTRRRAKRPTRYVEATDYLEMVRRIVAAAGRRVGEGDPEELAQLVGIRRELDRAITAAVGGLRGSGATWQQIGDVLGTTRQAAEQHFNPRLTNRA